jgi:transposase-like protein
MVTGHGTKLGRKKEEAIAALLTQRNIEEAARVADIGTNTLLRWLQLPEFKNEYRKARREVVSQTTARLQQAMGAAGTTVLKLMTDANVPAAVRLRAAECVLDHGLKSVEMDEIDARLKELEDAAETNKGGRR